MSNTPAFPVPSYVNASGETHDVSFKGMTLRDYFAAKAMQAEMSKWKDGHENGYEGIAELCYCMADAMMKAREE